MYFSVNAGHDGGTDAIQELQEVDRRSCYVGNVSIPFLSRPLYSIPQVDYGSTPEELQEHFKACGGINRITILCDKFSGNPKG